MGHNFFIVGIGASAGGESALFDLFANIPHDVDAAFIVLSHHKQDHQSQLKFLLSRHTRYPIYLIRSGEEIKPASIYLIPENTTTTIENGRLFLKAHRDDLNPPLIDEFFMSLAKEMKNRAIGIILSSSGADGAKGSRTIKEYGGMVMVQQPGAGKSDPMPVTLIEKDFCDHILPAKNMGLHLNDYIHSFDHKNELPS